MIRCDIDVMNDNTDDCQTDTDNVAKSRTQGYRGREKPELSKDIDNQATARLLSGHSLPIIWVAIILAH